jgi:class 3 adenylate cyclase/tetratricopeptide (TPR) repeat protein
MSREPFSSHAGSRFQLTLLFVDLSSSTAISQAMEPEHYMEVMAELRMIWQRVIDKFGGHLIRSQGDGALIVFGYPHSTEEDGRRAAEAALEIHGLVEKIRHTFLPRKFCPLRMHSGIHAGTVLMSPGDIERGRFDLSGEIPNTAAHLAAAAAPGQIVASMAVLGPHANYFELEQITWRGNGSPPKDLRSVVRRSEVHNRFDATKRRGLTPLFGRESIVAQIERFLASANIDVEARHDCLVLVGSAGMGKTRLINETLSWHRSAPITFMYGACENHCAPAALQPFTQMLRSYHGTSPPELISAPQLRVTGLVSFFTSIPQEDNLVIIIDDWQWADDASRQLVGALLALPNRPKILLATRPQDSGAGWIHGAPHIDISPLSAQQTALAVRRWIPHADPFLCESIYKYSGGVPLFIEELCHSASISDLKKTVGGSGITQSWLGSLVASRLAQQPTGLQELIRICAVIGNAVPLWLLEATRGHLPSAQTLTELEDADFLYPVYLNGQLVSLLFKHGITWDAVYKGIGFQERSNLHLRILDAVSIHQTQKANEEDFTVLLAHHSRGAGRWAQAAVFSESSGDKSMAASALDLANTQYKAALVALDRSPELTREQSLTWCKIAGKLALTSIFDPLCLGNDLSTFETAVQVATELQDAPSLAQATYWLGYLQYGLGNLRAGATKVREAIAIAHNATLTSLVAPFEATLGQILIASCEYDEGLVLLDRALEAKKLRPERLKGSAAMGAAYSLAISGFAFADRGQFDEARHRFDEALNLLGGTTHPIGNSVRNFICISYIWQEKWPEAEAVAIESRQIAENNRTLLQLASSRGLHDYIQWATGKDRAGLGRFKETLVWMDEHQSSFYTSLYFGFLTHACAAEGQIEEARKYALCVALRRKEGDTLGEAMACRAMAKLAAAGGRQALALRWMARAEKSATARKSEREHYLNRKLLAEIT